jgi:hypothetical protein
MVDYAPSKFKQWYYTVQPWLKFRPNTGRFWLDVVNILILAVIQLSIIPTFLGSYVYIDLITPWLITTIVFQRMRYSTGLCIITGLIIENHSMSPAGLYICAYWMICVVINLTRSNFSWRLTMPWLATFVGASFWITGFELLVLYITRDVSVFEPIFVLSMIAKFFLSIGFGMYLCRNRFSSIIDEKIGTV